MFTDITMEPALRHMQCYLRPYGLLGTAACYAQWLESLCASSRPESFGRFHVKVHEEPGGRLYYAASQRRLFRKPAPVYHALLNHVSFEGDAVDPVWVDEAGRAVVAWHRWRHAAALLVGLDVEEEMVRHRQGDPAKAASACRKSEWGFASERPLYLFSEQLLPAYRTVPWADLLGFFLAEALSRLSGYPLVEPLPGGARGAVMLSGDDDQAYLEKYEEQLRMIGDVPITYFLVPQTRHTEASLAGLPPNVELGLHPDALDDPEAYDRLCADQAKRIRDLSGRRIRTVRNHGFLNRGYLGHLQVWEDNGLALDLNYPGVDGTVLNGSFLPMRVRRADATWSDHYCLLTAFGDGMIEALNMGQRQAVWRIRAAARQIEASHPGVLVCNFHPQNIERTRRLHREVTHLARRPGWIALGADSYLDWLEMLECISIAQVEGRLVLASPRPVAGLVLRFPVGDTWQRRAIAPWVERIEVGLL